MRGVQSVEILTTKMMQMIKHLLLVLVLRASFFLFMYVGVCVKKTRTSLCDPLITKLVSNSLDPFFPSKIFMKGREQEGNEDIQQANKPNLKFPICLNYKIAMLMTP